ncbi:exodeoxyribonuclease V subunit gamma [Jeongeupia sp. USM3]|uniref:exodeoxyribonuclease V subunit gamma n=1 Tax=Jeongeupia sp. USM3 TaxID=1906741 RepID=UPI000B2D3807|nr:exodeoxyribonuclease V subunit gamma [Jeongeupia sp. USM3]
MNEMVMPAGLMVIHGNRPEALRDLLVTWMRRYPLAPLDNEVMLVQSNGIAQWLKLALARDTGDGGCGIAAALDLQLPSRFLWQAYRAVLGDLPPTSPFDKPLLVWRLMRLLPAMLAEPAFVPLARFLAGDADLRKRHQLAERLADLFDQYQVYRADWLADWADGDDVLATSRQGRQPLPETQRWQPRLWRALLADIGEAQPSRADIHRRFLAQAETTTGRPAGLPQRLLVFGISSLPQQSLEVLSTLSRWTQVLMCVHNPCEHYWADIVADKDLLRATHARQARKAGMPGQIDDAALHLHAHPLLAAWGKQGRDYIGLLDVHDERERYEQRFLDIQQRIDLFEPHGGDTLLRQLQDDIRDLRPLAESRARWPVVAASDASIRFHVVHSPQREVEVLHDQLLAALAADPTLNPRDVIVMVPDINSYAPHIRAVFGLPGHGDPRHIPFSLADVGRRQNDPLLGALEQLLNLPESRIAVGDVLDLLDVPAVRRRFGIDEDQLPLLHRWIADANIRWGLHAEQREKLELPPGLAQNSWDFGLRRMLFGYAVGAGDAWDGIEPMDEIGGLDAALLGPLVRVVERLEAGWRTLREPATPSEWGVRLRQLLDDFFDAGSDDDGFTLLTLDQALQDWLAACAAAKLADPLPPSVVREHWLAQLDQPGLNQPFLAGAVTFATLMPMRAIPFRHVCLLGMNDGDYPRTRVPMDFDLMARDYRPGDRSRREDDRYLFLEALLSARDALHIGWVGRSIHDDSERPPSVLVAQLRDHLAAGWRTEGGELLDALTVEHRLQPFDRAYFSGEGRLFSYAYEWQGGVADDDAHAALPAWKPEAPLAPWTPEAPLTLKQLADFVRAPVEAFFRQRLGVYFEQADRAGEEHEPFALDALQNWQLQHELIQAQLVALRRGESREAALANRLDRIARRGELPVFADTERARLAEPMDGLFARYAEASAAWPDEVADEEIGFEAGRDRGTPAVADWLTGLRRNTAGERGRVLLDSGKLIKERHYRRDKLIPFWIAHLAGHLEGEMTSVIVAKDATVTLPPLAPDEAAAHWLALLGAWNEGMTRPLPLAVQTGFAWLGHGGSTGTGTDGAAGKAARECYELHDPRFGRHAELNDSPYLMRAWPGFDALWADGEFALWADRLLRPLSDALDDDGDKA